MPGPALNKRATNRTERIAEKVNVHFENTVVELLEFEMLRIVIPGKTPGAAAVWISNRYHAA
jgi:hypothetical protein